MRSNKFRVRQNYCKGRITGAALISIGMACGFASRGEVSGYRVLVGSMSIYNLAVLLLLIRATTAFGMHGIAIWPASALHVGMAIWCLVCLRKS